MSGNLEDNELMPLESINDKAYQTRTNHTAKFARQSREYAQLYDKWESLMSDARRHRQDAEREESQAREIKATLEKIAKTLGGLITPVTEA